jgi:hypothetical protein
MLLFDRIEGYYYHVAEELDLGRLPAARRNNSRTHRRHRRHASDSLGLSICHPPEERAFR